MRPIALKGLMIFRKKPHLLITINASESQSDFFFESCVQNSFRLVFVLIANARIQRSVC